MIIISNALVITSDYLLGDAVGGPRRVYRDGERMGSYCRARWGQVGLLSQLKVLTVRDYGVTERPGGAPGILAVTCDYRRSPTVSGERPGLRV